MCPKSGPTRFSQPNFPNSKFHFFPRWSLWSGGGGEPPPPPVYGCGSTYCVPQARHRVRVISLSVHCLGNTYTGTKKSSMHIDLLTPLLSRGETAALPHRAGAELEGGIFNEQQTTSVQCLVLRDRALLHATTGFGELSSADYLQNPQKPLFRTTILGSVEPPPPPPWGWVLAGNHTCATWPLPSCECPTQGKRKVDTRPIPYWGQATSAPFVRGRGRKW